jgi:hypothetical protein
MMLKGKALQDRARELDIPGRSKMSADELRDMVTLYEGKDPESVETPDLSSADVPPTVRMAETQNRINAHAMTMVDNAVGLHSTPPMDNRTRGDNYLAQTGKPDYTHRQLRRMRKNIRRVGTR